jgi:hypothetical protein
MNKQIRLVLALALGVAVLSIPTLATAATIINILLVGGTMALLRRRSLSSRSAGAKLRAARSRWPVLGALLAGSMLAGCAQPGEELDEQLALRHAPVHYQDTDDSDAVSDYITAGDYDGDWSTANNWDNLKSGQADLTAEVYYSVVESCTHWFIVHAFYHPRDWTDTRFGQEHENDLEGVLAIVRKDGSQLGRLEGVITVFHSDFYAFVPQGSPLVDGAEDIDGELSFQTVAGLSHFKTSQEAKGHGLKAWPFAGDFDGGADQDGIIYFPSADGGEVPESGNDRSVNYGLTNVFIEMWLLQLVDAQRESEDRTTFDSWGTFRGNSSGTCGDGTPTCANNAAHGPWGWDDGDDGPTFAGEMALDPIHLVDHYFDGLGDFDQHYVRNRYLETLRDTGFTDALRPTGWPSQLSLSDLYGKLGSQCR